MKKTGTLFILALAFLGVSCDIIPYKDAREIRTIIIDTSSNDTNGVDPIVPQTVLIEDYTGHTCGNCPEAAREAHRIEKLYPGRVVIMGVHCSFFAKPKNYADGSFKEDFRTPAGDALDEKFKVSTAGLPKGIVNRGRFGGTTLDILNSSEWEGKVSEILSQEPLGIKATLTPDFSVTSRQISLNAKIRFQKGYSGSLKAAVYVTEDSLVNWQKEYDLNFAPPENNPNYLHMHVLRTDMIPGSGTDILNTDAISIDKEITTQWSTTLDPKVKAKNCHVILVVYKSETDEIVQVAEAKLTSL
ncbi:MAG TPA: Omp28-related outer membrane protein [Catalimonadaceae bacterium]|nr:Omp28-related outer membrane protein [Catalimonadaceae bacterium]